MSERVMIVPWVLIVEVLQAGRPETRDSMWRVEKVAMLARAGLNYQ